MRKSILIMKSLMVIVALSVVSCNSDDSINCPEPLTGELTAEETEFSGTWNLVAMESDEAIDITDDDTDNPSTDIFAQYSVCDRDLAYNYLSDRKYEYKQGYTAENCENKATSIGTWDLTGNSLTLVGNCASERITISQNEEGNQFSYDVSVNVRDVNGLEKRVKVTFTFEREAAETQPE